MKDDERNSERPHPLDAAIDRLVRDERPLLPTTEADVERAERNLDEHGDLHLPEGLRSYRARVSSSEARHDDSPTTNAEGGASGTNVRRLERKTSPSSPYWIGAGLLAVAAGFGGFFVGRIPPHVPVSGAGGELRPSGSGEPRPKPLTLDPSCTRDCCAGSECSAVNDSLRNCPSGNSCIACRASELPLGPYRLRLGTLLLNEAGVRLLAPSPDAPLEICVVSPNGSPACLPALEDPNGDDSFRLLDRVQSTQELMNLSVEVRRAGSNDVLASWKRPISITPEVLCRGLMIQPTAGEEVLGRLSAFVELTHFIELGRAENVPDLLALEKKLDVRGVHSKIYETKKSGADHFSLVLGPYAKDQAERLRWQVLDAARPAVITHGLEFVGRPRTNVDD